MTPDQAPQQEESRHRSFMLTPDRELSRRHRVARAAIIIYFATFLAASIVMCSCPSFFAVMAVCALVSFTYGSRLQRVLSAALLPLAVAGFFLQLQQERNSARRAHRARELQQQHLREQQTREPQP